MPNLWEKMIDTEPGFWARFIEDFLYDNTCRLDGGLLYGPKESAVLPKFVKDKFGNQPSKVFRELHHYLERLAFAELKAECEKSHSWVKELESKKP